MFNWKLAQPTRVVMHSHQRKAGYSICGCSGKDAINEQVESNILIANSITFRARPLLVGVNGSFGNESSKPSLRFKVKTIPSDQAILLKTSFFNSTACQPSQQQLNKCYPSCYEK